MRLQRKRWRLLLLDRAGKVERKLGPFVSAGEAWLAYCKGGYRREGRPYRIEMY